MVGHASLLTEVLHFFKPCPHSTINLNSCGRQLNSELDDGVKRWLGLVSRR